MTEKLLKAIADFSLLKNGQTVVVALSGGADSMALLDALDNLKGELNIKLCAAHFNHKIRGQEAIRDLNFAAEQCKIRDIEFFCGEADVPEISKNEGLSLELAARRERYAFLESLDADVIATAHTASDNLETVLFNLTRGTAIRGLCGIPVKRDKFIRPLIYCSREEIEQYCQNKGIPFVTDSTNLSDDYSRNKLRHNAVPVLKELNPSVESSVLKTVLSLKEDDDCLQSISSAEYSARLKEHNLLSVEKFADLHPAVAKRVLREFYYNQFGNSPDNFHLNGILNICNCGGRLGVEKNFSAVSDGRTLKFSKNTDEISPNFEYSLELTQKNNFNFKNVHGLLLNNSLDCDKIVGKLTQRSRIAGDKIYLRKGNGTKTLKKLYTEYSVPLSERAVWPILCDDMGVVWVYEIGVAKRCAVTADTKRMLRINTNKKQIGD